MLKKTFIILLFVSLILGWQLLRPGYYSMHDDLQVMRLYEMNRCFENGQIPCRFAPDLANNYGQPLFNFYSAFPYYLGQVFHQVGFTYIDTVKLLFLLSFFLSGVFVYLLAAEFVSVTAASVAAIAYMAAPYHALDIFVRGALAESWGLTLVPAVLLALVYVCRRGGALTASFLSFTLAALLTTHHITTLIFAPLFIAASALLLWGSGERKKAIVHLLLGTALGVGLSAFFFLPVLFERSLLQQSFLISDYFDFRAHYASLSQLFTKLSWGYGPSRFNSIEYPETLSFFVGIVPIISLLVAPFLVWRSRANKRRVITISAIFAASLFYLFMTHAKSVYLWEALPVLSFVQFPWRFLGPVALLTSLLFGFLAEWAIEKSSNSKQVVAFLVAFLISANFSYFRFENYFPKMTDADKLTGSGYDIQIRGALLDYLPLGVKIPEVKAPPGPVVFTGKVDINYFDKRSNFFGSEFDVLSSEAEVRFPVMYFPGWTVYLDRKPTPISFNTDNDYGLITVKLGKGHRVIQAFFENTPIRTIGNFSTLFSAIILTTWLVRKEAKNEK